VSQIAPSTEPERTELISTPDIAARPRTTVGWKGLINDPDMNGTFQINKGLRIGRQLLLDLAEMGLPTACEFLGTFASFVASVIGFVNTEPGG